MLFLWRRVITLFVCGGRILGILCKKAWKPVFSKVVQHFFEVVVETFYGKGGWILRFWWNFFRGSLDCICMQ